MHERFKRNKEDAAIGEYAELLLGYSLLAEGSDMPPIIENETSRSRHCRKPR